MIYLYPRSIYVLWYSGFFFLSLWLSSFFSWQLTTAQRSAMSSDFKRAEWWGCIRPRSVHFNILLCIKYFFLKYESLHLTSIKLDQHEYFKLLKNSVTGSLKPLLQHNYNIVIVVFFYIDFIIFLAQCKDRGKGIPWAD